MAEYSNWRNFWWLDVALLGATFLLVLFGFPETKWHRKHPGELQAMRSSNSQPSSDEKIAAATIEHAESDKATTLPGLNQSETAQQDPYLHRGRPSKQQFKLYQANRHPFQSMLLDVWIPVKLFTFPIIQFASFVVSWSASCFLTLNLTQAQVFAAPPYNFKPLVVGFTNFAVLVGMLIGLFTAGPLSDWISMKLTKRNRGIREPEMRLLTMIPYVFIMIIGNFVVAYGYQNAMSWKVSRHHADLFFSLAEFSSPSGLLVQFLANYHSWIYVRWHPSRRSASHCFNLRCRLIQTCRGLCLLKYHRQQESVGLRFLQVHHSMD